ncbi:MAG TPA: ABC transporter substrate-binding protein [Steroidobacteraceae bacterium]|nr:ABC transporter substrate-binding protein [Steroidobacteraceae bacterium]
MRTVVSLRAFRVCAAFALLSASLWAHAGQRVTLGVVNWIGYGPIYCAAANGYYKREGIDVRLVTFSDNSLMAGALRGGEIDASTLTYDQVITADAKGWNLKVVMPLDYSVGGDAILASAAVRAVTDLKGRKVAFQPLSPSDFLLGYALAQRGLSEKDVQPVNATPEAVVAIMATGAVDAGVTYQPSVSMILSMDGGKRYHVLLSSREARGIITDVLAVRDSTIARSPELVTGLIRGTMQGLAFMRAEPAKAAAIIGKTLEISATEVQAQLQNIENPPLSHLGDVFEDTAELPSFRASGKLIGQILQREGQIHTLPAIADTYDAKFVLSLQANPGDLK